MNDVDRLKSIRMMADAEEVDPDYEVPDNVFLFQTIDTLSNALRDTVKGSQLIFEEDSNGEMKSYCFCCEREASTYEEIIHQDKCFSNKAHKALKQFGLEGDGK